MYVCATSDLHLSKGESWGTQDSQVLVSFVKIHIAMTSSAVFVALPVAGIDKSIVIRNGKIVWKHGPNWPFYALMLRTKLC